jgi:hypothetical protein
MWRWLRAATEDNRLEYRWLAEFGGCLGDNLFHIGEYAFGVQLFKFPGEQERSGMLPALLRTAQRDFVRRSQESQRVTYSRIEGADVFADYQDGSVVVGVRGKSSIAMLASDKPGYALLTVDIPDEGQSYSCVTKVNYQ